MQAFQVEGKKGCDFGIEVSMGLLQKHIVLRACEEHQNIKSEIFNHSPLLSTYRAISYGISCGRNEASLRLRCVYMSHYPLTSIDNYRYIVLMKP